MWEGEKEYNQRPTGRPLCKARVAELNILIGERKGRTREAALGLLEFTCGDYKITKENRTSDSQGNRILMIIASLLQKPVRGH